MRENQMRHVRKEPVDAKFELQHIDILGPVTEKEDCSKYIILVVDILTKWCEAIPLKQKKKMRLLEFSIQIFL